MAHRLHASEYHSPPSTPPSIDTHQHSPVCFHSVQASGALQFPNGVPTSLRQSGQQWDYPNAWPPLQHMLISGRWWMNYRSLSFLRPVAVEHHQLGFQCISLGKCKAGESGTMYNFSSLYKGTKNTVYIKKLITNKIKIHINNISILITSDPYIAIQS